MDHDVIVYGIRQSLIAPCLYLSPVVRRRRGVVPAGVRRTAPVRPACLSIAKAMRVLGASRRHRAS
ncbi:hypothetical protein, partial [Salinisphaera hydrothermalis]|uniref:hypothetical protein n=1 Tax=Salinisphaera hydrothermalis TaxID=563188 RepID=UPI001E345C74